MSRLGDASREGGEAAALAAPALAILSPIISPPPESAPDFRRFLYIEAVRDSLEGWPLAAALFRELQRDFPESPIAPKALLAVALIEPDSSEVFAALMDRLYPNSPYRLVLLGDDEAAFAAIEDSLRSLGTSATGGETGLGRPLPADPAGTRPSPGRRLPEP